MSCQAITGGRSSPQVNAASTTRHFGMYGALSRVSNDRSLSFPPML